MKSIVLLATIATLTFPVLTVQKSIAEVPSDKSANPVLMANLTAQQLFERAELKLSQQKYKAAIDDLTQAIQLDPKHSESYKLRGFLLMGDSNDKALEDFTKAQQLNPKDPEPHLRKARIFAEETKLPEAIAAYTQYFKLSNPENISANDYTDRGRLFFIDEQYQEAMTDFNQAIQMTPGYATAYFYRGLTYKNLGNQQKALVDLKRSREFGLDGDDAEHATKMINDIEASIK